MKITQTDMFTIIEAEEGMILVGQDGYGATVYYLGIYDSPDNYTEIPIEDYVEPEPIEPKEEYEFPEELEDLPEPPEEPEEPEK